MTRRITHHTSIIKVYSLSRSCWTSFFHEEKGPLWSLNQSVTRYFIYWWYLQGTCSFRIIFYRGYLLGTCSFWLIVFLWYLHGTCRFRIFLDRGYLQGVPAGTSQVPAEIHIINYNWGTCRGTCTFRMENRGLCHYGGYLQERYLPKCNYPIRRWKSFALWNWVRIRDIFAFWAAAPIGDEVL